MEFCNESLASYKVPRIIEFRSSLPRNDTGKLMRAQL
jgi:long-chain acyl-CoA synthetase